MNISFRAALAGGAPLVGAHRGASARRPENTLAAFAAALEDGADFWEFDVRLSADGVPVVIHDETVDRTTTGNGRVADLTAAALADLGVPSLAAVLGLGAGRILFNIELKGSDADTGLVNAVLAAVTGLGLEDAALISSFHHTLLPQVKRLCPAILTGMLYEEALKDPIAAAGALGADALHPYFRLANAALIAAAGHAGAFVIPWTVDRPLYMRYFAAAGAAGIITNRPAAARQIIEN